MRGAYTRVAQSQQQGESQEAEGLVRSRTEAAGAQVSVGSRSGRLNLGGIWAAIELTEEQEALINEIRELARVEAHAAETPQARREIMETARAAIMAVLTPEQIELLEQARTTIRENRIRRARSGYDRSYGVLWTLELSDEQQALIKELIELGRTEAQAAETPEARREIMENTHEAVMSVLTPEQLEQLEQIRAEKQEGRGGLLGNQEGTPPIFGALELTEEQKIAIQAIYEAARELAAAEDSIEARRLIMQEAQEEVMTTVLTDEQIEQIEDMCASVRAIRARAGSQ